MRFNRSFCTSVVHAKKKATSTTVAPKFLGRNSTNLSVGIVGLANVGKSTLFQSLTKTTLGNPANYPFATINAEKSNVVVESEPLNFLGRFFGSEKTYPSPLTIYDIAGLTRNASRGEGLGNKFLSDIRRVDGLLHVIRAFKDDAIIHIEDNKVDPVRDLTIVNDELILKDIEYAETGIELVTKSLKKPHVNRAQVQLELDLLDKVQMILYEGRKIAHAEWTHDEIDILNGYNFLTAKPTVILVNVNENDYLNRQSEVLSKLRQNGFSTSDNIVLFCADYERKINNRKSAVPPIVNSIRQALHLISFYTCGPRESRQWSIREGSTAPEAAGMIHSDLQSNFISVQVQKYNDLVTQEHSTENQNLKPNKLTRYGKAYCIEDGDVIHISAVGAKPR